MMDQTAWEIEQDYRRAMFDHATKIRASDYGDLPVFAPHREGLLHLNLDAALRHYRAEEQKPPAFFWAAVREPLCILPCDLEGMLDRILERHHEGAEFVEMGALGAMIDAWNALQKGETYTEDASCAVIPDGERW